MEMISRMMEWLAALPDALLLFPVLLPVGGILLALLKKRKLYRPLSGVLWAIDFILLCAKDVPAALLFTGMYFVYSELCALLLLLPFGKRAKSREQTLYERFGAELPREDVRPPKICCFPPPAEGEAVDVTHALELIEKLKREKLSPADRLEVEAISRAVEGCGARPTDPASHELLNDSLASVLRLTAKYKL